MPIPIPDLNEQKRRIIKSLMDIMVIIRQIRSEPKNYLPGEELNSFQDSVDSIEKEFLRLYQLIPHEIDEFGNISFPFDLDLDERLEEEHLTGKGGMAKIRLLSKLKNKFWRLFFEKPNETPKILSAIMEYLDYGNTFVTSVENLIPESVKTPVTEFLSYTRQLISIRRDRMVGQ